MPEGPDVFGEAGAPEGKAWFQIIGGKIQLMVFAENIHHLPAIDGDRLAKIPDLVSKGNFERVERITGVLDHFGGPQGHNLQGSINASIKLGYGMGAFRVQSADDGK